MLSRRRLLGLAMALGGSLAAGYGYSTATSVHTLSVTRHRIPIPGLPERLAGFRIGQLSDFHWDSFEPIDATEAALRALEAEKPDLLCLTGDFITAEPDAAEAVCARLTGLDPRHGIVACRGNHDLWHGRGAVRRAARRHGIHLLIDDGFLLGDGLFIAGCDSCWHRGPHVEKALEKCPADRPALLLAHEPDPFREYARDPRVALQLSGHTHGGQVRLPFLGALKLPSHGRLYQEGLYGENDRHLYVNRGIGCIGYNVRINCPPELTLLELVPAPRKN